MSEFFKTIGAIFFVTGTCIGGGMLAVPLVTAHCGFGWSLVIFGFCWLVMFYSSLLVLEVNSALPANTSFSSMAHSTLGIPGKVVMWLMFSLLLYALLDAYDTGGASLLSAVFIQLHIPISLKWCAVIFTLVFGGLVFIGIRTTDFANRFLLSAKLVLFFIAAFWALPHLHLSHLKTAFASYPYAFAPVLVAFTAFGSHFIIPSIRSYIGPDPKRLRKILLIGMLIPLVVYIIWQVVVFGILPAKGAYSFAAIAKEHNSSGALVLNLVHYLKSDVLKTLFNAFMDIAVTTSFLGIALSLLDFFIDGLKLNHKHYGHRSIAAALTFLLPLLFAIFFPGGFILALEYAAVFAAVLVLILPGLMSLKLNQKALMPFVKVEGGKPLRFGIMFIGVLIIALHFGVMFGVVLG